MLGRSDRSIEEAMRIFASHGVEAGYLVPTDTGLSKSIMDAHAQLRGYLERSGIHDYSNQSLGPEGKRLVAAWHVGLEGMEAATASLYRPQTKQGDPRIWVTGLSKHAMAGNLVAVLAWGNEIYFANLSANGLLTSAADAGSPLGSLLRSMARAADEPALELLGRMRDIAARGFVKSLRAGPTGVGMTLETLLGINANSRKTPDYRGIEIKASRTLAKGRQNSRISLFSKVPDWAKSSIGSAVELLQRHGYDRDGRRQLYCSMNNVPNSLGLFLSVMGEDLHARHGTLDDSKATVQWGIEGLRDALSEKHRQTFWVKAEARRSEAGEEFRYVRVVHTKAPMVSNLESLFEAGHMEVDFALHLLAREGRQPRARDHGYLFKLDPRNLGLLFPPSVVHEL